MLVLLLSLIVFYFLIKGKFNTYIGLSFLFICFAPPISIGGITLNYGAYLVMAGGIIHYIYLLSQSWRNVPNAKIKNYNTIILVLIFMAAFVAVFSGLGQNIAFNRAIVWVLFLISINYFVHLIDTQRSVDIIQVIKVFVSTSIIMNLVVVIGQVLAPQVFTQFIIDTYYGDFRQRGQDTTLEWYGYFNRSTGLTYTPVLLGGLSLLLFFLTFFFKIKFKVLYLLSASFMGLMAFSKTFFLGLIITGVFYIKKVTRSIPRTYIVVIVSIFIFIQLGTIALNLNFGGNLFDRLSGFVSIGNNFREAIESRYDTEEDILFKATFQKIEERPVLGWGFLIDENVFIGDSSYIVTLYRNGIVGLFMLLVITVYIFIKSGPMARTILLMLSLIGFGTMVIDNIYFLPFWVLVLSKKSDAVKWVN